MEVNEMIKPNMINGLDLILSSCLGLLFEEDKSLSFVLWIRFGKSLITLKLRFKLITLKSWINLYGNQLYFDNLLQGWIP